MNICFTLSEIDWQLTKDVFSIIASIATLLGSVAAIIAAYLACIGVSTWKESIKLQKRYEYTEPLYLALDGMLEARFAYRSFLTKLWAKEISLGEFSQAISSFINYQSDFKRYSKLLEQELNEQEKMELGTCLVKVNEGFNVFLGNGTLDFDSFSKQVDDFNGSEFSNAIMKYKEFLNALKQ